MVAVALSLSAVLLGMVARGRSSRTTQGILVVGVCLALYLWQSGATTIQIMRLVYPTMSALSLAACGIMLYRHMFLLENRGVLLSGLFFLLSSLASGILALVTGEHPVLDFDVFRPYLVSVRFVMVVLLIIIFEHQINMCRLLYRSLSYDEEE